MADLVIKFADLASEPIGTGRDVTAEVLVTYTREVPLTDGTVLQPVPMRKQLGPGGTATFPVTPSDSTSVIEDFRGFGLRVEWLMTHRGERARQAEKRRARTVKVLTSDGATVQFGRLLPAEDVGPQYATVGELLDDVTAVYATVDNLTATATALPPGATPTVTVSGPIPNKVINIGVPRGADGAPGMGYEEGQQLLAQNQTTLDAAQAAEASAATAATDAATAMQAQFLTQDEGVAALITTTAGPLTKTALQSREQWINPLDYGAVGDGSTDCTAAIQAALDAGHSVILPPGEFRIDGTLSITSTGQGLSGWSRNATKIIGYNGPLIRTNPSAQVGRMSISDLTLDSRGGGGHVIEVPYGINQSVFQRVDMLQRNDDKSIVHCDRTGSTGGGLFDVKFTDVRASMPTTSTVPGFYIVGDSNPASANLWHRCRIEGGGTYLIHIEAGKGAAAYAYNNTFDVINFEFADHGAIRLLSTMNSVISAVGFFDNGTIDTDLIRVGRAATGRPVSQGLTIVGMSRGGGTLTGGAVDLRLETPNNGGNTISGVSGAPSAGVVLDVSSTETILTAISSQVAVTSSAPNSTIGGKVTIAGVPIFTGSSEPEGLVAAPDGAMYLRSAGAASGRIYFKDTGAGSSSGWRTASQPAAQNSTNLGNAGHPINTSAKTRGRPVYNNTTGQPLWASNGGATDPWVDATGAAVITPT